MAGCIAAGSRYESGCTGVSRSANRVAFVRTVLERNAGEKVQLGLFAGQGFHLPPLVRETLRVNAHVVCPKHVRTHNQRRLAGLNAPHRKQIQPYRKSRILANSSARYIQQFDVSTLMRNKEHSVCSERPGGLDFRECGGFVEVMDHRKH